MRIIFMGNPEFSIPSLKAVDHSDFKVVGVMTNPPKNMGRGRYEHHSPVCITAKELGIPLVFADNLKSEDLIAQLKKLKPELFIIVAYRILPKKILEIPSIGSVNLHGSLLPAYRGAAPIQRAIMNGENETGLTTFMVKSAVDTGDILYQQKVKISPDDNYGTLSKKMSQIGSELLIKTIIDLHLNNITPRKQDESTVTSAPKIHRDEKTIRWNDDAEKISNLIRGLSPTPGASTTIKNKTLKIFQAFSETGELKSTPGTVIERTKKKLSIQTGKGGLVIQILQKEGKKRMEIQEFLHGTGINIGDRFGN